MAEPEHNHTYQGNIPIADSYMGDMLGNQSRRSQGADLVHELLRVGAVQKQGRMTQADSLALGIAKEDPKP